MNIIEWILNLIFGTKDAETASNDAQTSNDVQPTSAIKTDKDMFYNYMLRGEKQEVKDTLWAEATHNEYNGVYRYTLYGNLGYYTIDNGQLVGNGSIRK